MMAIRAAAAIRESHPHIGVIVLSQYVSPAYAVALLASTFFFFILSITRTTAANTFILMATVPFFVGYWHRDTN